ncbi:polymer-forming cytoskeletal protein [Patescibacteria group bacterium]|nr:polymer-forming cytoskeletal protein [Patescibacteria group bacterium]
MFEKREGETSYVEGKAAETIVGSSVKLKGNLKSDGDITIDGHLNGEIRTKASVIIGPHANVVANIKAKNIEIAGVVQGNIEADSKLEVTDTGRVFGDIAASILVVSPGALFTGKCTMSEPKGEIDLEPLLSTEEEPLEEEKSHKKEKK